MSVSGSSSIHDDRLCEQGSATAICMLVMLRVNRVIVPFALGPFCIKVLASCVRSSSLSILDSSELAQTALFVAQTTFETMSSVPEFVYPSVLFTPAPSPASSSALLSPEYVPTFDDWVAPAFVPDPPSPFSPSISLQGFPASSSQGSDGSEVVNCDVEMWVAMRALHNLLCHCASGPLKALIAE